MKDLTSEFIELTVHHSINTHANRFAGKKVDGIRIAKWINSKLDYEAISIRKLEKELGLYWDGGRYRTRNDMGYETSLQSGRSVSDRSKR